MQKKTRKQIRIVTAVAGVLVGLCLLARMLTFDYLHAQGVPWFPFLALMGAIFVCILYSRTTAFSTPAIVIPDVIAWALVGWATAMVLVAYTWALGIATDPALFNRRAWSTAMTAWTWLNLSVLALAGDRYLGPLRTLLTLGLKPDQRSLDLQRQLQDRMNRLRRRPGK